MFNSNYLTRKENEWKQIVITVVTIIVVIISLIYLFICIVHEIRHTSEFRRQRMLILWSRLRHNMKKVAKLMKSRMGYKQKEARGLLGNETSKSGSNSEKKRNVAGALKTSGTFTKNVEITPTYPTSANEESTMAGDDINLLNVQHEKTHQMVNILEEKFSNILEKFDTMRSENERRQLELMNEQKQTKKLALAVAKKAVVAQSVEQARNSGGISGNDSSNGEPQQQTQQERPNSSKGNVNQPMKTQPKPKNCFKKLKEWVDKHENMLLGVGFLLGLFALMVVSM